MAEALEPIIRWQKLLGPPSVISMAYLVAQGVSGGGQDGGPVAEILAVGNETALERRA